MKSITVAAAAFAAACLFSGQALAKQKTSPSNMRAEPGVRAALMTRQPLQPLYSVTPFSITRVAAPGGVGGGTILSQVSGFTTFDKPTKVTCPGPSRCLITADINFQAGNNATAGNRVAVNAYLNGHVIDDPWFGNTDATGLYGTFHYSETYQLVKPGTYTMTLEFISSGATDLTDYSVAYIVENAPS